MTIIINGWTFHNYTKHMMVSLLDWAYSRHHNVEKIIEEK